MQYQINYLDEILFTVPEIEFLCMGNDETATI